MYAWEWTWELPLPVVSLYTRWGPGTEAVGTACMVHGSLSPLGCHSHHTPQWTQGRRRGSHSLPLLNRVQALRQVLLCLGASSSSPVCVTQHPICHGAQGEDTVGTGHPQLWGAQVGVVGVGEALMQPDGAAEGVVHPVHQRGGDRGYVRGKVLADARSCSREKERERERESVCVCVCVSE